MMTAIDLSSVGRALNLPLQITWDVLVRCNFKAGSGFRAGKR
jgi:hypothetical protein